MDLEPITSPPTLSLQREEVPFEFELITSTFAQKRYSMKAALP